MKTIDELIFHYERRQTEADSEIERILKLPEGRLTTDADRDMWIKGWREDKQIARDTVSYLKTLQKFSTGD